MRLLVRTRAIGFWTLLLVAPPALAQVAPHRPGNGPYQRRARTFVGRVGRLGYRGAVERTVDAMLRRGLTIDAPARKMGQIYPPFYKEYLAAPVGPPSRYAQDRVVYPELVRKLAPKTDGTLRERLVHRGRRIQKLVQTIDAPMYHEVEQRFLRDTAGARVLMVGRATDGFLYWVTAGLMAQGAPGRARARTINQVDISTSAVKPDGLLAASGPDKARMLAEVNRKLARVLKDAGYDASEILRQGRKLVLFDTGRMGTIPRQIKTALLAEVARSGDLAELRRLDDLVEIRMMWSATAEGSPGYSRGPPLTLDNYAEVMASRPIPGYIDVDAGRNHAAIHMIDERPHLVRAANAFAVTPSGRHVVRASPDRRGDFWPDPSGAPIDLAQQEMMRVLDARLFALALVEARAKMPPAKVLRRDHTMGMVRSRAIREHLAQRPEHLSRLRQIFQQELERVSTVDRGGGDPVHRYGWRKPSFTELRQIHRTTEQRFFSEVGGHGLQR